MGIPHLASRLERFASQKLFPESDELVDDDTKFDQRKRVIIDGPALAYYINSVCIKRRSANSNSLLGSIPTYAELGDAAIEWLQKLERHGLRVAAIFFDGVLPVAKRPIRACRLQVQLDQLLKLRSICNGFPKLSVSNLTANTAASSRKAKKKSDSPQVNMLPVATFLVPVIIEALFMSKYKHLTAVIPGEADAFCADYARRKGGIVITSDSDLLAHDLGPSGSVVFFRDIDFSTSVDGKSILAVTDFSPTEIGAKLGLNSLTPLAFVIKQNTHTSFTECLRLCKQPEPANEYTEFVKINSYSADLSLKSESYLVNAEMSPLGIASASLDPRLSEYIHETINIPHDGEKTPTQTPELGIYLPFLFDDPSRSSAWRNGRDLRHLGYGMLGMGLSKTSKTLEFDRRGNRMAFNEVLPLGTCARKTYCQRLEKLLAASEEYDKRLSVIQKWRMYAIHIVCSELLEDGQTLPSAADVRCLASGQFIGSSWSFIHFSAQVQACLYSLRLLQQICGIISVAIHTESSNLSTQNMNESLKRQLSGLPPLRDLLPSSAGQMDEDLWSAVLGHLGAHLGVTTDAFPNPMVRRRKRKKKTGQAPKPVQSAMAASRGNNMYHVLPGA